MYFIVIHVENYLIWKVLESSKIEKKMHNKHKQKREKQVIDHSRSDKNSNHDIVYLHYSFNCIFFSVIRVKIKLWFNCYSFHSLINFDMHGQFWQVSDTMGMPIRQKSEVNKLRSRISYN